MTKVADTATGHDRTDNRRTQEEISRIGSAAGRAFLSHHEVRFADFDRFGHVNHLQLLRFLECAQTPFFEALTAAEGAPSVFATGGIVVAAITANFVVSIERATTVEVRTRVTKLGTTSVTLGYELWSGGVLSVTASTVIVFVQEGKPQPMAQTRVAYLAQFMASTAVTPAPTRPAVT